MPVREIQSHLEEMYGAEVSPTLISPVTDTVMDEAKAWQMRPLDGLYPIVYMDGIHVKVRHDGIVRTKVSLSGSGRQYLWRERATGHLDRPD